MLKKVALKNFQIHKNSVLEFTQGLNVIAGSSDNGKSSIIRAIRWVIMNRPTGFAFHTHGAKDETAVCLVFDDYECVTRTKSEKNSGGYHYRQNTFAALRTDVPPEIGQVLNMEQINIQSQHDPYFLLQDSPGEVAKKLNVVAGLGLIGEAIKTANAVVRHRKDAVGAITQQELEYKADNDKLLWVHDEKDNAEQLERECEELKELQIRTNLMQDLITSYEHYTTAVACLRPTVKGWAEQLEAICKEKDDLDSFSMRIHELESIIYHRNANIEKLYHARDVAGMRPSLDITFQLTEELATHTKQTRELEAICNEYSTKKESLKTALAWLAEGQEELARFKKEHPLCPTCNKPWG